MRWVKAVLLAVDLSACSLIATGGSPPGPMTQRQIWWENHTADTYEMRFTEFGNFAGMGLVEPCSPGGLDMPLQEEFAFKLTAAGDPTSEAGTPVIDWHAWEEVPGRHVVAVIRPNGRVEVELREEPPSMEEEFCR
jgi:hypothetical protein